ncbi:MAG TPA: hypothetical protein VE549_11685 [Myxococcaceae bacterium]|nr:hypothetical protein [Myxococcaceae bacterium]
MRLAAPARTALAFDAAAVTNVIANGHPLRLPFTESSDPYLSLSMWVRTDRALEPFLVDPGGG